MGGGGGGGAGGGLAHPSRSRRRRATRGRRGPRASPPARGRPRGWRAPCRPLAPLPAACAGWARRARPDRGRPSRAPTLSPHGCRRGCAVWARATTTRRPSAPPRPRPRGRRPPCRHRAAALRLRRRLLLDQLPAALAERLAVRAREDGQVDRPAPLPVRTARVDLVVLAHRDDGPVAAPCGGGGGGGGGRGAGAGVGRRGGSRHRGVSRVEQSEAEARARRAPWRRQVNRGPFTLSRS